jgi:hypothetical protein
MAGLRGLPESVSGERSEGSMFRCTTFVPLGGMLYSWLPWEMSHVRDLITEDGFTSPLVQKRQPNQFAQHRPSVPSNH